MLRNVHYSTTHKKKKGHLSNPDNFKLLSSLKKERTPGENPQGYILEGLQIQ